MGIVRFLVAALVLCMAASCAENDSVIFKCEDGNEHDFISSRAISEEEADYIIYVNGITPGVPGHAWILDGYRYNINPETNEIFNAYVYCDWGWDGEDNGYYIGSVFETRYANYTPNKYFAAHRY